mmetsp:Transcript_43375/g.123680  ORF Transcript_43375/g.123680 Transcript_43375/m.123680 type:complete len:245 (-) Transcript_43375:1070-1804(-)
MPPVIRSHADIGGGNNGSSTHAARTCSSSWMPRRRLGTFTFDVQRVSGGDRLSLLKNSFQSSSSSSISKLLTPHHFCAALPGPEAAASDMRSFRRALDRVSTPCVLDLAKTASMKASAKGTVKSKFAISDLKDVLDRLLMRTSMLSVAVASAIEYRAASNANTTVPVSAKRLTADLMAAIMPSSRTLENPPWLQPPQQGGSCPYFLHVTSSWDQATTLQNDELIPIWSCTVHFSHTFWVHFPSV